MVFVLSPGADPRVEIDNMARQESKAGDYNFKQISLGQGQGPQATLYLQDAMKNGKWVLL
jgi:dynein heavy chain